MSAEPREKRVAGRRCPTMFTRHLSTLAIIHFRLLFHHELTHSAPANLLEPSPEKFPRYKRVYHQEILRASTKAHHHQTDYIPSARCMTRAKQVCSRNSRGEVVSGSDPTAAAESRTLRRKNKGTTNQTKRSFRHAAG